MPLQLSVVIPTLGNYAVLKRVLDGYERQSAPPESFEVLVVADRTDPEPEAVRAAIGQRPYQARQLTGRIPGASANRNRGWEEARAPIVLFTDSDTVPVRCLVAEHLEWHRRYPEEEVAVAGHVRWAPGLKVTPFMKWLDRSVQFNFGTIRGHDASWTHLYSANGSVKRSFLERVGGYDEEHLPYLYEDVDWAYRAREHGLRVVYNRRAVVDHWREMTVEMWQVRAPRLAANEWRFCQMHPDVAPWFWRMFSDASRRPPAGAKARKLTRFVPAWVPWLGSTVWERADLQWRQAIAPFFLEAWEQAARGEFSAQPVGSALLAERSASPGGSWPGGPK